MYGVTEVSANPESLISADTFLLQAGHSVLAHITDFKPYFYLATPRGFLDDDKEAFKTKINVRRPIEWARVRSLTAPQEQVGPNSCLAIKSVKKRSLWGYKGDDLPLFLKLTCSDPKTIPKVRDESELFGFCVSIFISLRLVSTLV